MDVKYTSEVAREIWDDKTGEHVVVGPDRDGLGLVSVRYYSGDSAVTNALTFPPDQAVLVAQAMLASANELKGDNQ